MCAHSLRLLLQRKGNRGFTTSVFVTLTKGEYRVKGHEGKRKGEEEEVKIVVDG